MSTPSSYPRNSAWSARNGGVPRKPGNGTLPNLEGNSIHTLRTESGKRELGRKITPEPELPRLIGTKSQASTASSSGTRDSGISMNDVDSTDTRGRVSFSRHKPRGATISVDTLPLKGQSVQISRREQMEQQRKMFQGKPAEDLSDTEDDVVISAVNTTGESPRTPKYFPGESPLISKSGVLLNPVENSPFSLRRRNLTRSSDTVSTPYSQISGISTYDYEDDFTSDSESEFSALNASSAKSSKIPIKRSSSLHRRKDLLRNGSSTSSAEKTNTSSVPAHVPDNKRKKSPDTFIDQLNTGPVRRSPVDQGSAETLRRSPLNQASPGTLRRSPIEQFSPGTLRRSPIDQVSPATLRRSPIEKFSPGTMRRSPIDPRSPHSSISATDQYSPKLTRRTPDMNGSNPRTEHELDNEPHSEKKTNPKPIKTSYLKSKKASYLKKAPRTKSVSPDRKPRQEELLIPNIYSSKSTNDLPSELPDDEPPTPHPKTEPPKRRYNQSMSVPATSNRRTKSSVVSVPRRSTAGSNLNLSGNQQLPLLTVPYLKSPYDGVTIQPWARPDEGLHKTIDQLESDDWEKNVDGLTGLLRLVVHHPETVIVEYKSLMQLLLKQVKNLRSQVARAAVTVLGEMFNHLKRNMESDIEKENADIFFINFNHNNI